MNICIQFLSLNEHSKNTLIMIGYILEKSIYKLSKNRLYETSIQDEYFSNFWKSSFFLKF